MVGIDSRTVLVQHFFHADIGMVDGILTHCGGSDAPIANALTLVNTGQYIWCKVY